MKFESRKAENPADNEALVAKNIIEAIVEKSEQSLFHENFLEYVGPSSSKKLLGVWNISKKDYEAARQLHGWYTVQKDASPKEARQDVYKAIDIEVESQSRFEKLPNIADTCEYVISTKYHSDVTEPNVVKKVHLTLLRRDLFYRKIEGK